MDGALQLSSGLLRPVPIYSRQPLQLDLSPRPLQPIPAPPLPQQALFVSTGARGPVKPNDVAGPRCSQQLIMSQALLTSQQDLLAKGRCLNASSAAAAAVAGGGGGKSGEGVNPGKGAASLVSPLRSPDPRGLVLYHTLLRQHPAYQHLLQSFLAPSLPPLFCHPAAALCERPFSLCSSLLAASPNVEGPKAHLHQQQHHHHCHNHHQQQQQQQQSTTEKICSTSSPDRAAPQSPTLSQSNLRSSPQHGGGHFCSASPPSPPPKEAAASEKPPPAPPLRAKRAAGVLTAEELVSSITAVPDPYQQYGYGRKIFPCPQCRYTTDRRNNLKRHMLTMHQVSGKLLECCGVLFQTKASLREHALIFHYHGYTCFYCGRRFCRKALLKRHLSVHNGQKEFLCPVCDYATSHKSNLERHRRVHVRHDDDDVSCMNQSPPSDEGVLMVMGDDDNDDHKGRRSEDEISVCSHDDEEEEEINVHSD